MNKNEDQSKDMSKHSIQPTAKSDAMKNYSENTGEIIQEIKKLVGMDFIIICISDNQAIVTSTVNPDATVGILRQMAIQANGDDFDKHEINED